jgi:hypothetical protein
MKINMHLRVLLYHYLKCDILVWKIGFKTTCGKVFISKISDDSAYWVFKDKIIVSSMSNKVPDPKNARFKEECLFYIKNLYKDNSIEISNLEGYDGFWFVLTSDKQLNRTIYSFTHYNIIIEDFTEEALLLKAIILREKYGYTNKDIYK